MGSTLRAIGESSLIDLLDWHGEPPTYRAEVLLTALSSAAAALGDGAYGRAASSLFGLSSGERGLPLKRRRMAAAEALDVEVDTFRREKEGDLLLDLAWELTAILLALGTAEQGDHPPGR